MSQATKERVGVPDGDGDIYTRAGAVEAELHANQGTVPEEWTGDSPLIERYGNAHKVYGDLGKVALVEPVPRTKKRKPRKPALSAQKCDAHLSPPRTWRPQYRPKGVYPPMTMNTEEAWIEPGDVNEWNSVSIPDSPEGIHDTPPQPERDEIASHAGQAAVAELVPVGAQELGPEQYMG